MATAPQSAQRIPKPAKDSLMILQPASVGLPPLKHYSDFGSGETVMMAPAGCSG